MHPGPDSMGAPASFAQRRPHAPSLPNFELPPPPASSGQKYSYAYPTSQAAHAPGSLASVGNLLTPPSTVSSEAAGIPTNGAPNNVSAYAPHGNYAWSPATQAPSYAYPAAHHPQAQRGPYSPMNNAVQGGQVPPSPATTEGQISHQYPVSQAPYPASGPMSATATMPTMASPQTHHQPQHQYHQVLTRVQTPVSTSGAQPSPIQAQDGFRAPATPAYYTQHPPTLSTPGQGGYMYSTGPSPTNTHPSPLSAGPMSARTQMSPASAAPVTSLPSAGAVHSPHPYNGRFSPYPHGPVLSNVSNPNGQPVILNGGLSHGMMSAGFNSGHAANLQHMYGSPHPQPQAHNDRPFKCDQCPQSFNRNHDLKRHKRIHLAVKPFPCGHCDKSFSRKDALKRHILVKGCGKAMESAEAEKAENSASPDSKNPLTDGADVKPVGATHS